MIITSCSITLFVPVGLQHGKAALHLAAANGHDRVADILLRHRAFVNAKSKQGFTPLHLAAQNGYNQLVKLLVEPHGATIDALSLVSKVIVWSII